MKAQTKADCLALLTAVQMAGSSAQTKAGMKDDCLALSTAVQMVESLAQTKTKAGTKVSAHTPPHLHSLYQRIDYCCPSYTYRCSNDKGRMFLQLHQDYTPVRLEFYRRR